MNVMGCGRWMLLCEDYSRSAADHDAADPISEAVWEQAGNVIIHDLHLTTLELAHLKQADLVLLRVLWREENGRVKYWADGLINVKKLVPKGWCDRAIRRAFDMVA